MNLTALIDAFIKLIPSAEQGMVKVDLGGVQVNANVVSGSYFMARIENDQLEIDVPMTPESAVVNGKIVASSKVRSANLPGSGSISLVDAGDSVFVSFRAEEGSYAAI